MHLQASRIVNTAIRSTWRRIGTRGTSLMELLVSMLLSTVVLTVAVRDFSFVVHSRADMDLLAETQQAADASITFLTQELRQAGACLPELGNFISLDGADGGTRDSITLRIGIADRGTLECDRTILKKKAAKNQSMMKVESAAGFEIGQWFYLIKNTGYGNFFKIAGIAGKWITIEGSFNKNFGRGSGVYAFEERTYQIEDLGGVPVLTVAIDGDAPQPLVRDVEELNIQYRMDPCPPCSAIDEPANDTDWRVVREVELSVVTRSSRPDQEGNYRRIENRATVKPRNLL